LSAANNLQSDCDLSLLFVRKLRGIGGEKEKEKEKGEPEELFLIDDLGE